MKIRYLFVKITDFTNPLASKIQHQYHFSGSFYYESSMGESYHLSYNDLFERDGEYTAYARLNEGLDRFEFKSDYWNVLANYKYEKNGVIVISNDPLLVAKLVKAQIKTESIYDCLIFGRPYAASSYFCDIKKITPSKYGYVSLNTEANHISLTGYTFWRDLLGQNSDVGIEDLFRTDFTLAKKLLGNRDALLQFSGGSDSVTILNALMYYKFNFKCISYSTSYNEDKRISNFCRKFSLNSNIIPVIENNETAELATVLSGGLAPTSRFTSLFTQINPTVMFDGYAISKGAASDASIHPLFKNFLIMKGRSSITDIYPMLQKEMVDVVYDYWMSSYSRRFGDINTKNGLELYQNYAMEYLIQNVMGQVLSPAMQLGFSTQSYFLTLPFILSSFNLGYGFASSVSIRNDYPGYRQNCRLLANINRNLNKSVYQYPLDKYLSFQGIYRWSLFDRARYLFKKKEKYFTKKYSATAKRVSKELYITEFLDRFGIDRTDNKRLESLDRVLAIITKIVNV